MRVTLPLWKQNINRMFRKHWLTQGKRKIIETGSEEYINKLGYPVVDAIEFTKKKYTESDRINITLVGVGDKVLPRDENHPEYKKKVCHLLDETKVLVEGFKQAQNLTKTVHMSETLPDSILSLVEDVPDEMHESVQNIIMTGNVFDCEQKKLPKIHDPERPAYNFPRILGITDVRKNYIMSNMLMNLIEQNSNKLFEDRLTLDSVTCEASFLKNIDLIRIQTVSNVLLSAKKPLKNINEDPNVADGIDIPDIYPVKYTASIPFNHFYKSENIYPIDKRVKAFHPHTTYLSYNQTQVKNLYDLPVTEDQMKSRSLLHAFAICLAYAKELYGDVEKLPKPVTLQCIQSDGKNYYFGVLQMNTFDVSGTEGVKNMWYSMPMMQMYESCGYVSAKPTLESYNPEVIKYLRAFYHSQ